MNVVQLAETLIRDQGDDRDAERLRCQSPGKGTGRPMRWLVTQFPMAPPQHPPAPPAGPFHLVY